MQPRAGEIRLEALSKSYGKALAVDEVTLDIKPGSLVALLGPSGCGKTTCLRMIAGLIGPSAGRIFLNGSDITNAPVHRRNIGMLFQNYALFPQYTVGENVAFPLNMRRVSKAEIAKRVGKALEMVQLSSHAGRYPAQLSGGQQQRVALARALVFEPDVLLLDEPLAALDKGLRETMQVELRALQQKLNITTVIVTHDQDEALTMADRIVVMCNGRIEQGGTAEEIYRRPATEFVATFLGASNLFHCEVVGTAPDARLRAGDVELETTDPLESGGRVTVSVRPESVSLSRPDSSASTTNSAIGTISQVVYRGFITHYHLHLRNGQQLIAYEQNRAPGNTAAFGAGDTVQARWSSSGTHVIRDISSTTEARIHG